MILTCPACQTRYVVDPALIGAAGRIVRCAKCANSWHQVPNEKVDEATPSGETGGGNTGEDQGEDADTDPEEDAAAYDDVDGDNGGDGDGRDDTATGAAPEQDGIPGGATARRSRARADRAVERQAGDGKRKAGWIGWFILVLVLIAFGAAGLFYQQKIVEFWPPAGQLFGLIGMTPEPETFGLAIRNVKWEHKRQKGQPVLVVLGEVINTSDKLQPVPRLRVVIRDERDQRLFRWTVTTALNNLQPGEFTKFSTRLSNPPQGARRLAVTFQLKP